ncbi:MAG: hypothetical protein ACRDQD_06045 [Nocardioidaceae bacterium]
MTSSHERRGWRGMTLAGNRLRYRPPGLWWWRPTLSFEPEGLVVEPKSGEPEMLSWNDSSDQWSLTGVIGSRSNRAGIRVRGTKHIATPTIAQTPPSVWMPSTWSTPPIHELPALTEYLRATQEARTALAMPDRIEQVLAELATKEWSRPRPPHEPLLGDPLDVFVAVRRAIDSAPWRLFGGRPVRGEPLPHPDCVVERARALLAPGVSARVDDRQLVAATQRHLAIGAWPFDVLVA